MAIPEKILEKNKKQGHLLSNTQQNIFITSQLRYNKI